PDAADGRLRRGRGHWRRQDAQCDLRDGARPLRRARLRDQRRRLPAQAGDRRAVPDRVRARHVAPAGSGRGRERAADDHHARRHRPPGAAALPFRDPLGRTDHLRPGRRRRLDRGLAELRLPACRAGKPPCPCLDEQHRGRPRSRLLPARASLAHRQRHADQAGVVAGARAARHRVEVGRTGAVGANLRRSRTRPVGESVLTRRLRGTGSPCPLHCGFRFASVDGPAMSIDDLWYKNAIIYWLDVEKYQDANGDGIGDFEGLSRRLDYLSGLGVTCVWLQPFYPSPNRDNGYDVADFYGVHDKHGSLGDFVSFMQHADALGIRVIVDLVANHTSTASPWFQQARLDPKSPFRHWYVWADERPKNHREGIVFPGEQTTTWTRDAKAGQYYFHRFYDHQPHLNTWNPYVRAEIQKIMGFWAQLGVSGFRSGAVPFLIEKKGPGVAHQMDFNLLKEMREFLTWRSGDAVMLAEANVPPDESLEYFGPEGDRLQMMLNFAANQRLFYARATGDIAPLVGVLEDTRKHPRNAQWVQFRAATTSSI